ncbi:DUF262 domain-containing protein [Helicobacter brantae]|uniref:Uncharacterized protein n=1 Tax=Helicobacter brantae TaxID=375927 RepID=A0A3D8IZ11_9HELI|nr:DUF262 domain-containing protein [Helicobacter brantae]RDU70293.1 hypothetical protein CQA58_06100 [Helicobacter brantae]
MRVEALSLREIFELKIFIPPYKQDYVWREKVCKELLEDIFSGFEGKMYMGSLEFLKCEDGCEIIDGLQRLGTLSLILKTLGIESGFGELGVEEEKIKKFISEKLREKVGIGECIMKNLEFCCVFYDSDDECPSFDKKQSKEQEAYERIKIYHLGKMIEKNEGEIENYSKKFDEIVQRADGRRGRKLFYELLSLGRVWIRDKSSERVRGDEGFSEWVYQEFCPNIGKEFERFRAVSYQDMGILRDFGEGRGFFEYLFYFDSLLDKVEEMSIWRELKKHSKYLRFIYELMMLVYLDKFRESNLAIAHLWIFRCVYSLPLQQKITRSSARDWGKELLAILYHSGSEREAIFRLSKKIESNKKKEKLKNKELYTIKTKEREQYHIPKFGGEQ